MKQTVTMFALLCFLGVGAANASTKEVYQTREIPGGNFRLTSQGLFTLPLGDGWRHVKKIFVAAEASSSPAIVEVIANGDVKGTLYLPAKDPLYVVTVGETVGSLQFRHLSGGDAYVVRVSVVESVRIAENAEEPPLTSVEIPNLPEKNVARWISSRVIAHVDKIKPYSDLAGEYVEYLLPVKTVAGRAYAVAIVDGDLSDRTLSALKALVKQMEYAQPVIKTLLNREETFQMAIGFLAYRHAIENRFRMK